MVAPTPLDAAYLLDDYVEPSETAWKPRHFVAQPPTGLAWHYTDAAGLMGIVSKHQLWASASLALNDTSEIRHGTSLIREVWVSAIKDGLPDAAVDFTEKVIKEFDFESFAGDSLFVLSASLSDDLLSQWRNYAGTDGFAIGIDVEAPLSIVVPRVDEQLVELAELRVVDIVASGPFITPQWAKVVYAEGEQREVAASVIKDIVQIALRPDWHELGVLWPAFARTARSHILSAAALLKHPAFMDEREVRFLCSKGLLDEVEDYQVRRGRLIPYVRAAANTDGNLSWVGDGSEPLPIRAVRYGPNSDVRGLSVAAALLARKGYTDVTVDRSDIPVAG